MPDNPFRLDGKSAIVVGAALGIGRAIALAFADAGAKVACLDIDEEAARETAAQIKSGEPTDTIVELEPVDWNRAIAINLFRVPIS
jgi:NAD(P)-dependent dehydrogenase (short-subunit alcohol dehydrogenase family)